MRLIDADALMQNIPNEEMIAKMAVAHAPSIDIVHCRECCSYNTDGYRDGCGFCFYHQSVVKADDFCSYGSRSEKPNNSKERSK